MIEAPPGNDGPHDRRATSQPRPRAPTTRPISASGAVSRATASAPPNSRRRPTTKTPVAAAAAPRPWARRRSASRRHAVRGPSKVPGATNPTIDGGQMTLRARVAPRTSPTRNGTTRSKTAQPATTSDKAISAAPGATSEQDSAFSRRLGIIAGRPIVPRPGKRVRGASYRRGAARTRATRPSGPASNRTHTPRKTPCRRSSR